VKLSELLALAEARGHKIRRTRYMGMPHLFVDGVVAIPIHTSPDEELPDEFVREFILTYLPELDPDIDA